MTTFCSRLFGGLLPVLLVLLALGFPQTSSAFLGFGEEHASGRRLLAEKNKKEGTAFLAENRARQGVLTTETGLQYEIVQSGDGPRPKKEDQVSVHYEGRFLDGRVFDSSRKRGRPATFPLNAVIPGWTEGLQYMPVGSLYRFYIPSDLAYGERGGGGGRIPPNATLIFDVELLAIP